MKYEEKIDELIKASVKAEGLQDPGPGFSEKLMSTISEQPLKIKHYKPLLSTTTLYTLVALLAIAFIGFINFPSPSPQLFSHSSFLNALADYWKRMQFEIKISPAVVSIIISSLVMLFLQTLVISKFIKNAR